MLKHKLNLLIALMIGVAGDTVLIIYLSTKHLIYENILAIPIIFVILITLSFALLEIIRFLRKFNLYSQKHLFILVVIVGILINIVVTVATFQKDLTGSNCGPSEYQKNDDGTYNFKICNPIVMYKLSLGYPIFIDDLNVNSFTFWLSFIGNSIFWIINVLVGIKIIVYFLKRKGNKLNN